MSTGCIKIDLSTSSETIDLSQNSCNSNRCPPCFFIEKGNPMNTLTLNYCSTMRLTNDINMGTYPYDNTVNLFTFINADTTWPANVATPTQSFPIANATFVQALCATSGSDHLILGSPSGIQGLTITGDQNGVTGLVVEGELRVEGKTSLEGELTVSQTASFGDMSQVQIEHFGSSSQMTVNADTYLNRNVNLGDGTSDSVTIYGNVGTSGSPDIDFSMSGGMCYGAFDGNTCNANSQGPPAGQTAPPGGATETP